MMKKMKKTIALVVIYCMVFSFGAIFSMEANASTKIPEYKKISTGYFTKAIKYKDKTMINFSNMFDSAAKNGTYFYDGEKETKLNLGYLGKNVSEDKLQTFNSGYGDVNIVSLETGKELYNIKSKLDKIETAIKNKYKNELSFYAMNEIRDVDGVIWASYSVYINLKGSIGVIVKEDGQIIELESDPQKFIVSESKIYSIANKNYNQGVHEYEFEIIDKNTGKIEQSYLLYTPDILQNNISLGKDYVWLGNHKYELKNNSMNLTETYDGQKYTDKDVNGNLYIVENGYVKKLVGKQFVNLYAVDPRMEYIEVYDENNMIIYGGSIYTIINHNPYSGEDSDWSENWASKEIKHAMDNSWIETTNKFRPEESITRAEFVKIVNKAFGFKAKASSEKFTDVTDKQWWYNEVLIALKAGYITEKNTTFRPNDKITREEVASIVTSIKKNKDTNLDKIKTYKDFNKVSNWAQSSVEGAIEAKYMGVNSTMFNPKQNITRAQSVVTLYRIVK